MCCSRWHFAVDSRLHIGPLKRRQPMLRGIVACAILLVFIHVLCAGPRDQTPPPTPIMKVVEPDTAKAGDEVKVTGTDLCKTSVDQVYLTQGDKTIKVKVSSQTDTEVKFNVPETLKAGRFGIAVLTSGGDEARIIDEPVFLSVE